MDEVEFALLYDANQSKPIFPYSKFERFNIDDWDEEECWTELRFDKDDHQLLLNNLQIPVESCLFAKNGMWWHGRHVHSPEKVGLSM